MEIKKEFCIFPKRLYTTNEYGYLTPTRYKSIWFQVLPYVMFDKKKIYVIPRVIK